MPVAITRAVSPTVDRCELSHVARQPIDVERAEAQHERYERCLESLGCTIVRAEPAPHLPDAVFVEDAAVVLDEVAIITRPGAASRRGETESIAVALQPYRTLRRIEAPATVDGGDVLRIGRMIYAGHSMRTNDDGIQQLGAIASEFGYAFAPIAFRGCLHLKSAVTQAGEKLLLVNPAWIDGRQFRGFEALPVDGSEPFAANILRIGGALLYSASYPRTRLQLEARGLRVESVEMSEMEKAEGGVTCCSILVE